MTVGERIKYRREELGMTQDELARKMGVTYQLISRYENNKVDTIPTRKLKKIAEVLECDSYWLMEGINPEAGLTADQVRLIQRIKSATPEEVAKINSIVNLVIQS